MITPDIAFWNRKFTNQCWVRPPGYIFLAAGCFCRMIETTPLFRLKQEWGTKGCFDKRKSYATRSVSASAINVSADPSKRPMALREMPEPKRYRICALNHL